MRALTIYEPWATAIACNFKHVENRGWKPQTGLLRPGQDFAIHSSKRIPDLLDVEEVIELACLTGPTLDAFIERMEHGLGHVVAVARYCDATAKVGDLSPADRQWFIGPVAWRLDRVRPLTTPVAVRGQQGLWELPIDVLNKVLASVQGEIVEPEEKCSTCDGTRRLSSNGGQDVHECPDC